MLLTVTEAIEFLKNHNDKNMTLRQKDAVFVLMEFVEKTRKLSRYSATIAGGCECCGTWVEHEFNRNHGEWVKFDDLNNLLTEKL